MANGNTQLYAVQGNGGKSAVTINELSSIIGGSISVPPATSTTYGGVKQGAGITSATSPIPSAAPAGGTGTAAGAWDTSANRDAAITTINALRTAVSELQTKVNALISSLSSGGTIAGG